MRTKPWLQPMRYGLRPSRVAEIKRRCHSSAGSSLPRQQVEVVQAANERGVAMVYTGVRHFRH